jgi:tripartite ATP-independent transporter DctP family solute receptor
MARPAGRRREWLPMTTTVRRRALVVALPLVAALAAPAALAQAPLKLRLSVENTPGSTTQHMLATFRDDLKTRLGDAVAVDYFDSGVLGNEGVHMDQIRTGQIDVYPLGSDAIVFDKKWAVFDMPFMFKDRETAERFLDSPLAAEMSASMRRSAGVEVLSFGALGLRQLTNNVRPIVRPEDLKGIKMRVPGSQTRIMTFRMLGAAPVTMSTGELYLGLKNGTVDGQEQPLLSIKSRSLNEVQTYLSLADFIYTPITLIMNGRTYDRLTPAQREAVQAAAKVAAAASRQRGLESDAALLKEFEASMKVNRIDTAAFRAAAQPIWKEIAPIAGEEFTARVVAFAAGS